MTKGERIKQLRLNNGISQTELAERIGQSKQTVYKYENNIVTNIPSDMIEKIALVLNTTPSYLLGWEENTNRKSASVARLENNELTPDEDKQLSSFIDWMLEQRKNKK